MKPVIMGLDLSLTAPAAVVLSARWKPGQWKIASFCWKEVIAREAEQYGDLADWEEHRWEVIARELLSFGSAASHVFVEGYAFGRKQNREKLAELGGVVKFHMWKHNRVRVVPMNMASARKTLLGHVPSKKTSGIEVKDYVNHSLARMGAKFETMDEGDAFVIANAGRAALGLSHVGVSE